MLHNVPLFDALTRRFNTDAHVVPYIVPGYPCFARLKKDPLALLVARGVVPTLTAVFVDRDNPKHQPVPDGQRAERLARLLEQVRDAGLPGAAGYATRGGDRLVWPLTTPLDITPDSVPEIEARLAGLRRRLIDVGADGIDDACSDWTRLYRLPFVVRDGERQRFPADLTNVEALDLTSIAPVVPLTTARRSAPAVAQVPMSPAVAGFRARQVQNQLRRLGPAISGQKGNRKTFVAAIIATGNGLSDDDAWSLLQEYNQGCVPPWSTRDLRYKFNDAC